MVKWTNVSFLEDRFWGDENESRRSNELSPLYIERYRGPRTDSKATAHSFWELFCVLSGRGALVDGKKRHPVQDHSIYLIPPNVAHREEAEGVLDTIWIGLRGDNLPTPEKEIYFLESESLSKKIVKLWEKSERKQRGVGKELDGMCSMVLGEFFRVRNQKPHVNKHSINYTVQYLRDNFREQISFADLAKEAGLSEGHFYRVFKQLTGETPSHFLTNIRIRHACNLLRHSNYSMEQIAGQSGFQDKFYFSRVFKKCTDESPSQFRMLH